MSAARVTESVLTFDCGGERLIGVLHAPRGARPGAAEHALAVVVGGGQYRVGAHRQFVLLARELAARGTPVLRFDVRGMGDSDGEARHFLSLGADLAAALDAIDAHVRPRAGTLLWGLCDGASAALLHAARDRRVRGVALINPWVSTGSGRARAVLRHHYSSRVRDPRFWSALVRGRIALAGSLGSFAATLRDAVRRVVPGTSIDDPETGLADAMFAALDARDPGSTLVVVSERDLTAREFEDELGRRAATAAATPGSSLDAIASRLVRVDADHTFSEPEGRERLVRATLDWIRSLDAAARAGVGRAQSSSSTGGS